jgi:phospholipid/cholesterol/gamma-HCH transport system substrate-binding protein
MKRGNPAIIGAFIIGAVVLMVAGVLILGSGKFFVKTVRAVIYFDGSVQGLQVGAPVTFRGVKIGSVVSVELYFDRHRLDFRVPVIIEIPEGSQGYVHVSGEIGGTRQDMIVALIKRGLRAQLQTESLVTGQLFVQLDIYSDLPVKDNLIDPATYLVEIPAIPTTMQEVSQAARKGLAKLAELPLEEIVVKLNETLHGIEQLVNAPDLREAITNLNVTMRSAHQLVQHLDTQVGGLATSATTTLGQVSKLATDAQQMVQRADKQVERMATSATTTLGNFSKLAQNTDGQLVPLLTSLRETSKAALAMMVNGQDTLTAVRVFLTPTSPIGYEFTKTLQELADAGRAIRVLANSLERNPNALLFGKKDGGGK